MLGTCIAQDLPIVTAIGGDGKNVNWPAIKVAEESEDGPGFFYCDCCQGVMATKASSTLTAQGSKSYSVTNLHDGDPMTAWVEGVSGYGIGEWFEVEAGAVNTIYNGYQSTPLNWRNNSRVKRFKVSLNDSVLCYLDLTDEMGAQRFDLGLEWFGFDHRRTFRFEIVEVYKGDKYDDVAISHVDDQRCCFAANTFITSVSGTLSADLINKGAFVMAYDFVSDSVSAGQVTLNASQQHVTLLRVTAGGQSIEITPDHPLYVEGIGFTSLNQLRTGQGDEGYSALAGMYRVLLWSQETQSSFYSEISAVEVLHGKFPTYTIRGLSNGSYYIANGFVSKTY